MQKTCFVKPAPGIRVRRPELGYEVLPECGALVAWTPYYQRRLQEGAIVVVTDEEASDEAAAPVEESPNKKGKGDKS